VLSHYELTLAPRNQLLIDDFRFQSTDRFESRSKVRLSCRVSPTLTVFRHSVLARILGSDASLRSAIPPEFLECFPELPPSIEVNKPNNFDSAVTTTIHLSVGAGDRVWLLTNQGLLGFLRFKSRIPVGHCFDAQFVRPVTAAIARPLKPFKQQ
jgi:hypothetical protein